MDPRYSPGVASPGSEPIESIEKAFARGDDDALKAAYQHHGGLVYTFCRRTLDEGRAKDVTQEVWLIRPDAAGNVAGRVSLGVIDPTDPGSLAVPAGYDPDAYFVVDISVEPRDGDASHSGRTILRGPLQDI